MLAENRIRTNTQDVECAHMGKEVAVQTQIVYPVGILRGTLPRIMSRKCSHYADCRLTDKAACPMAVDRIH